MGKLVIMIKAKFGEASEFIRNLPETDHCVYWPFYLYANGYAYVWFRDAMRPAHRVALILSDGGLDKLGLDASHSCHIRRCVNPRHLSWKTRSENLRDRAYNGTVNRGEINGMAKLTRQDVASIHADRRAQHLIAKDYGIAQPTVSKIKLGQRWVA